MASTEFGFPDFIPVIVQKHEKFFAVTQDIGPLMDDLFSQLHSEPFHTAARHLAKMVANSMNAVLLLGANGFGTDSLKVARSMFEAAVTLKYLHKHPEEFDDYFDFHFIVAKKRQEYIEKYSPDFVDRVPVETVASNKAGYEEVKSRYTDKTGRVRYRWSRKDFAAICADVGLAQHYLSFYDFASHIMHGNINGVFAQADREPGVMDLELAPSQTHVRMALQAAHGYFMLAVSEYVAIARPEKQAIVERIAEDYGAVWEKS
jgi:Family of unknown function (DUF5677)